MEDKIKSVVKNSLKEMRDMQAKVDDLMDNAPDDIKELREAIDKSLTNISEKLNNALAKGEELSEEAKLEANLGLMEAKEKLESSQKVLDNYIDRLSDQSKTAMDEFELKAHLAKMDAEDFWEQRGPELTKEFNSSKQKMQELTEKAADEFQAQFKKWNSLFGKR